MTKTTTGTEHVQPRARRSPTTSTPSHPLAVSEVEGAQQESVKIQGKALAAKVKELLHEGNVRRIVVKNDSGHTVMEIPVTAGVLTAVALPILTAVGALAALASDWTIEVHRRESE